MKGAPFTLQLNEALQIAESQARGAGKEEKGVLFCIAAGHKANKGRVLEPWLAQDQTRSPSPPSSASTLCSLGCGGAGSTDTASVAAVSDKPVLKWPNSSSTTDAAGDWETMLSESAASPGQEQAFLRLIMSDVEDQGFGLVDPVFGFAPFSFASLASSGDLSQICSDINKCNPSSQPVHPPCFKNPYFSPVATSITSPAPMFFRESTLEKPQLFDPNLLLNQHQLTHASSNPAFFSPLPSFTPSPQPDQRLNFSHLPPFPYLDMLFKAAEFLEVGNFVGARGILARLNHQLPSPIGKSLPRSAFYFKEALQLIANSTNQQSTASSPLDVVLKISAYKAFSEVSPILQFTSFTATQALLEELASADCIHIIDFDIGVGGQWSSFMHELAQRPSLRILMLKITAFVSPSAFQPLELHLIRENLSRFATDLNIPFEINIASIEAFDPAEILILSAGSNEAIAVNLPVEARQCPSFSTLLRLVKQLLPKIVISVDHGFDQGDFSFSQHFLHALQYCVVLLESIDAAGCNLDVANKIEKFVLQPKIENCIIRCNRAAEKILPWRMQFVSAGFLPVHFSNFTEMQAECLLKRVQVRGFHVQKRQASLHLYWQRGELASVSIWRC